LLEIKLGKRLIIFLFHFVFLLILKTKLLLCFHFFIDFLLIRLTLLMILRNMMVAVFYWQLTELKHLLTSDSRLQAVFILQRYLLSFQFYSSLHPRYHLYHSFLVPFKLFHNWVLTSLSTLEALQALALPTNTFTHPSLVYSLTSLYFYTNKLNLLTS
jgi:hypothetical protein